MGVNCLKKAVMSAQEFKKGSGCWFNEKRLLLGSLFFLRAFVFLV